MDVLEPDEVGESGRDRGVHISVHAPCNNIVVSGEHAAVTIHLSQHDAQRGEQSERLGDVRVESESVL